MAFELTTDGLQSLKDSLSNGDTSKVDSGHRKWINLVKAAEEAGLKVIPVDTKTKTSGLLREGLDQRNEHMAAQMAGILEESPDNKIVFWGGNGHTARTPEGGSKSAADLLREKNYPIVTVNEGNPSGGGGVADHISAPIAVKTAQTKHISNANMIDSGGRKDTDGLRYGAWDIVVAYPHSAKQK
jgi:hypothetical protein